VEVGIAPESIVPDSAIELPAYALASGEQVRKTGNFREIYIRVMELVPPEMAGT
jgi:hypothetical protein